MSYVWPNGNFPIFLFQFGSLVIKAMAFWEILPLALLHTQKKGVLCMVKCEISIISQLFWCVGCHSQGIYQNLANFPPKSAICQNCQNQFISLIHHHIVYALAITKWVSQVSITLFLCKRLCKYNYKYGYCPDHMYIGYGMLVQYQSVIFSCLTLISIAFILYVT